MAGRPTVMNKELLEKIEEEIKNGASFRQTAMICNISERTLHNYFDAHPKFKERLELLQHLPNYLARKNILSKIRAGDVNESHYWLDRRDKDFAPKQEIEIEEKKLNIE